MKYFFESWRPDMQLKRLLINGVLAATFALSAVAVESGAFSNLASIAFADPSSMYVVSQSNPKGSSASVSGSYNWTTDATFTITVTGVSNSGSTKGQITKVTVAANNMSQSYNVSGSSPFLLLTSGLSMSFSTSGTNAVGNTYSFSAAAHQKCSAAKTMCN
jgi:hypothetical protein